MFGVYAVAEKCGIINLPSPQSDDEHHFNIFNNFFLTTQGEVARIRIRGRRSRNSLSVQLRENTRRKIQHYVSRIREIIDKSTLPNPRKKALHDKLNDLMEELEKRRLGFGKTVLVLSAIMYGLNAAANSTTIAADGRAAVSNILTLIGQDKESEEAALSRLAPPPKALPAPERKPTRPRDDLDNDIPF